MFNIPQQFNTNRGISMLETFSALANTALTTAERLITLNLNTTQSILEESLAISSALSGAKGLQDLTTINNKLSQPSIEKFADYSRSLVEIVQQSGEELSSILQSEKKTFSPSITSALKKAA